MHNYNIYQIISVSEPTYMYFNENNISYKIPKGKYKRNRRPLQAMARDREAIIGLGKRKNTRFGFVVLHFFCSLLEIGIGGSFYKLIKSLYSTSSCAIIIGQTPSLYFKSIVL